MTSEGHGERRCNPSRKTLRSPFVECARVPHRALVPAFSTSSNFRTNIRIRQAIIESSSATSFTYCGEQGLIEVRQKFSGGGRQSRCCGCQDNYRTTGRKESQQRWVSIWLGAARGCKSLQALDQRKKAEIPTRFQRAFLNRECASSNPLRSARQSGFRAYLPRSARKGRQWRAFANSPLFSTFPIDRFGRSSRRKSPPDSADIPVSGRLRAETWFDCDCQVRAAVESGGVGRATPYLSSKSLLGRHLPPHGGLAVGGACATSPPE